MEESKTTCYSDKLSTNIQKAFEEMRKNGYQCDLIIKTGEREFAVHKIVMAATSDYSRDLARQNPLILDYINESTMSDIIDFCYTSRLDLNSASASEILEAASKFKMKDLVDLCVRYFDEKVSIVNYGQVLDTVSRTALAEIPNKTLEIVLNNFDEVAADGGLLKIDASSLAKILSSDNLQVRDEETVLKVVREWYDESPRERASSLEMLLDCVRFALFAPKKLLQLRKDKLVFKSDHFLDFVNEAIDYQVNIFDMDRFEGSEKARARLPSHFEPGSWIFIVYERAILKYDLFHNTHIDITCPASTKPEKIRDFLGGAIIADKLYIVADNDIMEIYDILNNKWAKPVENKQIPIDSIVEAVFAAGDFVYVILDDIKGSFARFDSQSKTWQTLSYDFYEEETMQSGIRGACSLNGEATIIIEKFRYPTAYKYTRSKWVQVPTKKGFRYGYGYSISFDGKLYSPQGRRLVCLDEDFRFHELPKMTLHRDKANIFEIDGQIVVLGGEPTNTLERYNTKSGEWSTLKLNASFDEVVDVVKYVRKI